MGAGSYVVHKLRRKLDHLLFNIISSQTWPLSSSFLLGDSNFCNLYEYNWFVKNLSCGYLKFAPFADNRYTQQHARSFSSFSLPLFKSHHKNPAYCFPGSLVSSCLTGFCNIHTSQQLSTAPLEHNNVGSMASTEVTGVPKSKKKKLKGKRAVVRWLKFFRWKKKKEYERMTLEEKVLYKLKKALDKSKYRDALHAVRRFIPKLEQDLEDLHEGMKQKPKLTNEEVATVFNQKRKTSKLTLQNFDGFEVDDKTRLLEEKEPGIDVFDNYESLMRSGSSSEPENLSDIFETDSDEGVEDDNKHPLYLEQIEKFPSGDDDEPEDFQEHLRRIAAAARGEEVDEKELKVEDLDDIDKIFLRASSLLKRKR
ncbi:hypothetical protein HPP92_007375 [Vanilla planifolia]|uniref:Uncharacterized protein n=1 Tax=Vanilla planifolia TaxID=51239 RepID=A0A835RR26_VANPL|nr:hypothetical protein HPP92_007375 [Vanilla planifolia]